MTIFRGMLLFDMPEPAINGWENQLGYRGYVEVWEKGEERITLEPDEDHCEDDFWEVVFDNGNIVEIIGVGNGFEEADQIAKEYMASH